MRMTLAAVVVGLGLVITVAAGVALNNYGILADQTRIDGWNPALWVLLLAGVVTALVGTVQVAIVAGKEATLAPASQTRCITRPPTDSAPTPRTHVERSTIVRGAIPLRTRVPSVGLER